MASHRHGFRAFDCYEAGSCLSVELSSLINHQQSSICNSHRLNGGKLSNLCHCHLSHLLGHSCVGFAASLPIVCALAEHLYEHFLCDSCESLFTSNVSICFRRTVLCSMSSFHRSTVPSRMGKPVQCKILARNLGTMLKAASHRFECPHLNWLCMTLLALLDLASHFNS